MNILARCAGCARCPQCKPVEPVKNPPSCCFNVAAAEEIRFWILSTDFFQRPIIVWHPAFELKCTLSLHSPPLPLPAEEGRKFATSGCLKLNVRDWEGNPPLWEFLGGDSPPRQSQTSNFILSIHYSVFDRCRWNLCPSWC